MVHCTASKRHRRVLFLLLNYYYHTKQSYADWQRAFDFRHPMDPCLSTVTQLSPTKQSTAQVLDALCYPVPLCWQLLLKTHCHDLQPWTTTRSTSQRSCDTRALAWLVCGPRFKGVCAMSVPTTHSTHHDTTTYLLSFIFINTIFRPWSPIM